MIPPITIEAIKLAGFRAYLKPQTIDLYRDKTPLSLAVFAPNATGKSSLVDAIEYYFSEDATLARLGKRQAQTHAGPVAIEHVDAEESSVTPAVHMWFRQDKDRFDEARPVSKSGKSASPLPDSATRVLSTIKLPFIIRGHELRSFVETATPEDRYKDIISWFALDPLLVIQQNLRALRRNVKKNAESKTEETERLRDLKQTTNNAVATWDEAGVCSWFNTNVLAELDKKVTLGNISDEDASYQELVKRKAAEDKRLGLGTLRQLTAHLEALFAPPAKEDEKPKGKIIIFENAASAHGTAVIREAEERSKASQAIFNDVWESAKKVFEDKIANFECCPVCDTGLTSSPYGSREKVLLGLKTKLAGLAAYRAAEDDLQKATKRSKMVCAP